MVLCKYFIQGNCRYGSKCHNEHLDIKTHIKQDVEQAIKGKQWPFSCYGPFRDKANVPNFIEDQSFEEVRWLCYEAKQRNTFEQFHQQFVNVVVNNTNKLQMLGQVTPEIVDMITNIYNTSVPNNDTGFAKSNNPFSNTNSANNNIGGTIFGKPTTATTAATNAGSIFGGGGFGTNNNVGIFGGSTKNSPFGGASTGSTAFSSAPIGSTVFGGNMQQQSQASIFGGSMQKQVPSIFGSSMQSQQQHHQQHQQTSVFGQPQQPVSGNNIFGQAAQQNMGNNMFGQAALQQQTQQQNNTIAPGFGMFSNSLTQQPAGQSVFGAPQQQQQNMFGQQQQQVQPQTGFFSQAPQQMVQPTPNQSPFNQPQSTNMFGQSMQQVAPTQLQQQQQQPQGVFQQSFQQTQQPQIQMQQQQQQKPANLQTNSATIYSRMENLSADEIEAFKADVFLPGKIPFSPPPRELI